MKVAIEILTALILLVPSVHAQRSVLPRPDAEAGPTEVEVGIYVNDVLKVDGAEQLLTVDFFLALRWRDPSQAGGKPRAVPPTEVWMPNVVVINEGRLFAKLPDVAEVDAEGNMRTTQRYVGTLTNRLPLVNFPFDRQAFRIQVACGRTEKDIRILAAQDVMGQRPELTLTDWDVEAGRAVDAPYYFPPTGESFVGLAYEIPARRRLEFYLWKGIFPLSLVVIMAFSVFWIDPGQIGPRMSVSVTSMLTLIAYRFLLGALLPRLSYLTRMDWYTLGCTALVFLALVTVVSAAYLGRSGREDTAARLDRLARGLFPVAFVLLFATSFFL